MIDKILEGNRTLESAASGTGALDSAAAGISGGKDALGSASAGLKTMQSTGTTLQDVTKNITQNQAEVQQDVKTLQADMEQLRNAADAATQSVAVTKASADLKTLHTRLDGMQTILQALLSDSRLTAAAKTRLSAQSDKVAAMQKKVQTMQDRIAALSVPAGVTADLQAMKQAADDNDRTLAEISALLQGDLTDETAAMEKSMQDMIDGTSSLLDSLQEELGQLNTLHQSLGSALDTSDASLEQIKEAVSMASARTDELLGALEDTEENGRLTLLSDFLSGDPAVYGQFFSEPVQITTKEIYPIANYGSAMTPFYTILALWVGALILTALIKVKADPESIPGIRHWQLFFGRYLLFFLLGQIQTAVVVLGNEYLLHCQILDPVRFWITAALASFVFTLIVYTLTISFGDIGKALAVVIMVIQIAGSGGTYPIELLPSIYRQIYIFFPFPYAINAMRETIGGSYGNTWQVSLLQLLIFAAVALVIGLLVRIPFIGLNSFVEKRMEDTELM
jgi:putative membrane protein